ncbi:aldehyde dehydrogenase (NADP(+)) [Marinobacter fonticola]|uniref:aldehyde dehydrogenase (NADP(+)) n=1 Tax=Marinobacter fonticola TaxID=2603215 RepID=UPI0011E8182B|nr:aldehyde dehydrogenase (NADP(+)) [Marinobacter fonticola]
MSHILGQQYIGGQRKAAGQVTLQSLDANTGEAYAVAFKEATADEVTAAAQAAAKAFVDYRETDPNTRADFLDAIADEIDDLGDDVIAEVQRESALPEARLKGERSRTSNQLRLFASVVRRGDFYGARIDRGDPQKQPPKPDIRQMKIALGPVAVFGASNFPFAFSVAGGDTASALAAGCPVVVKAHPGHMVTSECVANAIERAVEKTGMPKGVFNMIYGDRVGAQLVQEPAIKAVGFTGSQKGGRALFDLANTRPEPIPVFAEMSSINPVFMLSGALEQKGEEIAKGLAGSVAQGCGQFCTNPGLVIVERSTASGAFIEKLSAAIADQAPQTMLNAGIVENYGRGVERLKGLQGVEEVSVGQGGDNQAAARLFTADKHLLLSQKETGESPLLEEVFGPVTVVVEVDGADEMLAAARALNGQLTATVFSGDDSELRDRRELLAVLEQKVGRLLFNGYPTGVEVNDAMVHGGPYPATSDARGTSVGSLAIERYLRPLCYQNMPDAALPDAVKNANPLALLRLVDGAFSRDAL